MPDSQAHSLLISHNSRTAFTLLETDTFWLSHEPFKPGSHFPGACCPRLATFALFQVHLPAAAAPAPAAGKHHQHELGHGHTRVVALINTHLDQISDAQRKLGAAMVLHRARYEARIRPDVPVFVTGDLNRCLFRHSTHAPPTSDYFSFSGFLTMSATPAFVWCGANCVVSLLF
jgi:hypothetical protein